MSFKAPQRPCKPLTAALTLILMPNLLWAESASSDAQKLDAIQVEGAALPPLKRASRAVSRLDLPLQQQPMSADVISQDALRAKSDASFLEALEQTPGLVPAYSFGVINLSGRGFSGVFNSPILFDGVRYPGWQVTPRLTLNYHQVEVLRGPAALTAGQGSVAGAINLVPRRADGDASTTAYLGYGRYGTTTAGIGTGGSIGHSPLAYRLDLSHQQSAERGSFGYARDTSFEFQHVNAEIAAPVSDSLRLSLSFEHFLDDGEGYFGTPLINGRVEPRIRDINYNITDDSVRMDVDWLRARAEWQPADNLRASLVLFGNQEDRYYRNAEVNTWQPDSGLVRRSDYLEISHDQKLRGAVADLAWTHTLFGREHQLVVGVQGDRNDHDRSSDSPFRFTDAVNLLDPQSGIYQSLDVFQPRTSTDIEQQSVFVESALTLAPRWQLVSGLRHDRSDVDSLNMVSGVRFDKRYNAGTYRLGLSFSPNASTTYYGSVSSSSEPPAQITTLGLANATFDLTDSDQLELGMKHSGERFDWTLALYDLSRTNLLSRDPEDANRLIQIGEQAARGIEATLRAPIGEAVRVEASAAILDARFERFDERVGSSVISRRGNDPVASPERIGTLWAYYSASPQLEFGLGVRGVGESAANTANTLYLPGYATVDALIRYDAPFGRVSLRLRNLDDRVYATRPYGTGQFMLGEPRWYELTWQRSF